MLESQTLWTLRILMMNLRSCSRSVK
uniref:Uncharacterized protein n=1 Tax=Anguilla anguilla TaxID=7936 RepID=A0A0E9SEJ6_ANGAN